MGTLRESDDDDAHLRVINTGHHAYSMVSTSYTAGFSLEVLYRIKNNILYRIDFNRIHIV